MSGAYDHTGAPIPTDQAWRLIYGWKVQGKELGILVAGSTCSVSGVAHIAAIRSGQVELLGDGWGLRLNLRGAEFTYGSMTTWPRWPYPPTVDVIALQSMVSGRDWVVLAEGWRPVSLPPGTA
jgi:hypothetical protein